MARLEALSDRILIAENRCTALFVSTDGAAVGGVDRATVHPPGYMEGPSKSHARTAG